MSSLPGENLTTTLLPLLSIPVFIPRDSQPPLRASRFLEIPESHLEPYSWTKATLRHGLDLPTMSSAMERHRFAAVMASSITRLGPSPWPMKLRRRPSRRNWCLPRILLLIPTEGLGTRIHSPTP